MTALFTAVRDACVKEALEIPRISIEPGRAIVGPTMFTLYEVGTVKEVVLEDGGMRNYISVDGGMSDNIRPSLYGAIYTGKHSESRVRRNSSTFQSGWQTCETGDIVIRDIQLPVDVTPGDLLAMPATGAYGRSMASNYNHVPRPQLLQFSMEKLA
ncbi:MAG: hypothetical protein WDO06_02325 [Actinomycetota bacterium]